MLAKKSSGANMIQNVHVYIKLFLGNTTKQLKMASKKRTV